MKKLTRRQLATVAAASLTSLALTLAAGKSIAQTAASAADTDWYRAALEAHKANSAILAQFQIAMSTEPACQFKA